MPEILLTRHAQAKANNRDFASGNVGSPLTLKGIGQCSVLRGDFVDIGVVPEEYRQPILSSRYLRPQQTAIFTGFSDIAISSIINESDLDREVMSGVDVIRKHREEWWAPDEVMERAAKFIEQVRDGTLPYEVYFTHGMFIGAVLLNLEAEGADMTAHAFDDDPVSGRGYIPLQASITPVSL